MQHLDRYILLTEAMKVIAADKPAMLLDCIVDESMINNIDAVRSEKDDMPHVLYAGKLHKEFGLDILENAIRLVKTSCIFDIYGDGNYMEQLKACAALNKNVRIHGIVPLEEVLQSEFNASVLINPRTSAGAFTKYSFPSKTAEYMLAGVPVVMFRLPGVSAEYEEYLCFANEETPESLACKIDEVLSKNHAEWCEIGKKAKKFVIANKRNDMQAQRVLDFIL